MASVEEKIHEWLRKEGYPLELYAYKLLREAGFVCEKSALYEDVESHDKREIDVFAEYTVTSEVGPHFNLTLLVECKKSEKPLLILCEDGQKHAIHREIYGARVYPSQLNNSLILAALGRKKMTILDGPTSSPTDELVCSGYSMLQAFRHSDDTFHRNLFGLAKAEYYFENNHERLFQSMIHSTDLEEAFVDLIVPILLVDSPLFNVYLDDGEIAIEGASWGSVTLNLPWYVDTGSERQSNIQVVTKERFSDCVQKLKRLAEWLHDPELILECIKCGT
jgi:hypothetical protein